jgi:ribosomal protein S21
LALRRVIEVSAVMPRLRALAGTGDDMLFPDNEENALRRVRTYASEDGKLARVRGYRGIENVAYKKASLNKNRKFI